MVFLKISQHSQENTYARVTILMKLRALLCNFIKKETLAQVFSCEFDEIFKCAFFLEHFWWLLLKNNTFLPILGSRGNLPNKFSPSSLAISSAPPVVGGNNCDSVCKTKLRS